MRTGYRAKGSPGAIQPTRRRSHRIYPPARRFARPRRAACRNNAWALRHLPKKHRYGRFSATIRSSRAGRRRPPGVSGRGIHPRGQPLVGIVTCHCPGVGVDFERAQEQPVDKLEDAARDTYPVEHIDGFRRQPSPQLLGHLEHGHITAGSTYRIILVAQGIGRNVLGHRAPCPRGFVIDTVRPGIPRNIAQQVGAGALFPVALGKNFSNRTFSRRVESVSFMRRSRILTLRTFHKVTAS